MARRLARSVGTFVAAILLYAVVHRLWLGDGKFSRNDSEEVKVFLLAFGMVLVGLRSAWHRWLRPLGGRAAAWSRGVLGFLLLALCVASVTNYGRHGTYVIRDRIDVYDMIHYYLNARYFEELGYFDLYPACILADHEADGPHFAPNPPSWQAQDASGYSIQPFQTAIARGEQVKARFSPDRWAAFRHDFTTLQREYYGLTRDYWYQLVNDHGFNGTPGWVGYASPIARVVPVEAVKLLGYLDLGLMLVAVAVGAWAFGPWAAGFLVVFLANTYSTRWPTITWAFLRYDYAVALILATAFMRKARPVLAGIFAGHAAAMRLFPLTWLFGPGVQAAWTFLRHRRVDRFLLVFFLAVAGWIALLQVNFTAQQDFSGIQTHWNGMSEHMEPENLSSRREGLAIALAYRGERDEGWSLRRIDRVEAQEGVRKVVAVGILLALGWALRRSDPAEAFALGFIPFFALATASYYYYVVRAPLILVHAGSPERPRHALALAFLLGIDAFTNFAQQYLGGNRIFVIGWLGWLLLLYCVGMIAVLLWEDRRRARQPALESPCPSVPVAS